VTSTAGRWVGRAAALAVLGVAAAAPTAAGAPAPVAAWAPLARAATVVDVVGPRSDGTFVVATAGRLAVLTPDGTVSPFARGAGGYATRLGTEAYLALTPDQPVDGADCAFHQDDVYALEPAGRPGVVVVDPQGRARRAVNLPRGDVPNGIVYDAVGAFGHRLLVTARAKRGTAVFAINCDGQVHAITTTGPRVEGGLAVAPATFGPYAGDLIAPDELSGRIIAFDAHGGSRTVAVSGLPTGGDVGVESAGFVPPGFGPAWIALLADRRTPGNPHPGSDQVLRLAGGALLAGGARPGDLVVATEGGAQTVAVSCPATCTVQHVADGPTATHAEGHVVFAATP
jgi:hypothetical protein